MNYEIDYFVIPAEADSFAVIPAKAGIQKFDILMVPGFQLKAGMT
ncbi:MAG: hypothetical protein Q8P01_00395 [bacterium]|nr:hypothetical protein [bacterium]